MIDPYDYDGKPYTTDDNSFTKEDKIIFWCGGILLVLISLSLLILWLTNNL